MFEGEKHDGVSPIIFKIGKNAIELRTQFHQLWDYLVPPSGRAETAQGEIIRIAGRVRHEMLDNGCINWDDAFADSGSHSRHLGNLLILEPYMHTLRQGLADLGRTVPVILQKAIDLLWDYLEGKKAVSDFQDFANNLYAAKLLEI